MPAVTKQPVTFILPFSLALSTGQLLVPSFSTPTNSRWLTEWPAFCQWRPTGQVLSRSWMLARCSENLLYRGLVVQPQYCCIQPGFLQDMMYWQKLSRQLMSWRIGMSRPRTVLNCHFGHYCPPVCCWATEFTEVACLPSGLTAGEARPLAHPKPESSRLPQPRW